MRSKSQTAHESGHKQNGKHRESVRDGSADAGSEITARLWSEDDE